MNGVSGQQAGAATLARGGVTPPREVGPVLTMLRCSQQAACAACWTRHCLHLHSGYS